MSPDQLQYRTVHGYQRAYRIAGSGPALLLIHGIGDNSTTWTSVHSKLAEHYTVIAPDLLGHGLSDKPRADYSVAAYANGMRDLLSVLSLAADRFVQSQAGAASGTLSGQPRPRPIGMSIDGGLACASVEPSVKVTIECTMDCGCTTTSMRS